MIIQTWTELAAEFHENKFIDKLMESKISLICILSNYIQVCEFPRDLMFFDDFKMSELLNCDLQQAKTVKESVAKILFSNQNDDNISLLLPRSILKFGISFLDLLMGGGLPSNAITEIYGPAGSGKTQICIKLLATTILSDRQANILYISTQERFAIERLTDFLPYDVDHTEFLDRVHLQYFTEPEEEHHFINYFLYQQMKEYNYKLIIYDGIASNARLIESPFEKAEHINLIIASFRRIMLGHRTAVFITNQITDVPDEVNPSQKSTLGLSLDNNINCKICIEYNQHTGKRKLSLVKSLFSPPGSAYFTIEPLGIKGVEP